MAMTAFKPQGVETTPKFKKSVVNKNLSVKMHFYIFEIADEEYEVKDYGKQNNYLKWPHQDWVILIF